MGAAAQTQAHIVWAPQPGPQHALLTCPCDEIFFGGARGGGKTDGMLGEWAQHAAKHGLHAIGVFFRKALPQLEEAIERAKQIYLPIGAEWREQKKTFIMPGGARLKFRMLERDTDAEKYQGHSYTRVYFEELTNWANPKPVRKMKATLRSGAGVHCKFMATGNPGGPGHTWVKARYIDPAPHGYKPITEVDPITKIETTYVFIPSKVQDNKILMANDPGYVARLGQSGSEQLVRAWLEGDWDIIEGAFFSEWRAEQHVMSPWTPPDHLQRFLSFDWGSAKPFSVGFWAVSDGTIEHPNKPFLIPRGALIRYNEWYGSSGEPNVGLKMTAESVGAGIVDRGGKGMMCYADPAIFIEDGGPSIAERMFRGSDQHVTFYKADNKRIPGWDQVRSRLKGDEDGKPMVYVCANCTDIIRTLPALQHDENHPEDCDTHAEDHAPDEFRYACMSRPWVQDKPKPPEPIRTIHDVTMDEVWSIGRKSNKSTRI